MCNFSEGIWEDGIAKGKAEGMAEGRAESLRNLSMSLEHAMEALGIPTDEKAKYERLIATTPSM